MAAEDDHDLEFLLAFNGRRHFLEDGSWLKFEIKRVNPVAHRPHGLSYSFTMHRPDGTRILGFDNAHAPPRRRSKTGRRRKAHDHWHRTAGDEGRPYNYRGAAQLLDDFFDEVERICAERGIASTVVNVKDVEDS